MKETKDSGLEDVKVRDFVEGADSTLETETKNEESKLEGITSFPWKSVSHVVIGPNGVSLVPTGTEKKFSLPQSESRAFPTPGLKPTAIEYDLNALVGAMNAVSNFEKTNKSLMDELANTRAELEKIKAELSEATKPKATVEAEKKEEDKPEEPQPEPEPKKDDEDPAECEKAKEESKLEEKKDAVIAGEMKHAEHTGGLADAMRLMQVAKERNLL